MYTGAFLYNYISLTVAILRLSYYITPADSDSTRDSRDFGLGLKLTLISSRAVLKREPYVLNTVGLISSAVKVGHNSSE